MKCIELARKRDTEPLRSWGVALIQPALFMTVRREIVEPRRETGVRSPEAPIRTRALQGGSEGEPALRRLVGTHGSHLAI